MFRGFQFRLNRFIIAVALIAAGYLTVSFCTSGDIAFGKTDLTSLGILLGSLVFYIGILVIISMFKSETVMSVSLILPSIVAIGVFVYGFIGWSMRVSISQWKGLNPDFTLADPPMKNFIDLFTNDKRFGIDLTNTAVFTILFIVGCLAVGLTLAILLDQRLKGENFFRGVFLFPMSISFIATGTVWGMLLNPATGNRIAGLNLIFKSLGLDFLISQWLISPAPLGMAFAVLPAVWQMSGFTMALYMGGLRSIPEDLREAARVDGASEFQIYRRIILPLLQPVTLSAVIILGHISLKIFDLIVNLGHNDLRLDVPGIYMWRTTFDGTNYAQGAAIGVVMLLSVAVLVVPYLIQNMRSEAEL